MSCNSLDCKNFGEEQCKPPKCKYVKTEKRQYCRSAINKKQKPPTPKQPTPKPPTPKQPTPKPPTPKQSTPKQKTIKIKKHKKQENFEHKCKNLSKNQCLPPECKFVETDKRQYCRNAKRNTTYKPPTPKPPTPKQSTPKQKTIKIKKHKKQENFEHKCKNLSKDQCLPPECKFVETNKRQYCRNAKRNTTYKQPTPKPLTPKQPTPKQPTPKLPTPKLPTPKQPTPKQPTPKLPTPKPPTPKPLTPKPPTPKPPTPKPPTPKKITIKNKKHKKQENLEHKCKNLSKDQCLPPECKFVETNKRQYCRNAKRNTTYKQPTPKLPTPKQPTPKQPTPKLPTPKLPTPKLPTPKLPTPKPPTPKPLTPKPPTPKPPTPKKITIKNKKQKKQENLEHKCKNLSKDQCLPPKCKFVETDIRQYCRSGTVKTKKEKKKIEKKTLKTFKIRIPIKIKEWSEQYKTEGIDFLRTLTRDNIGQLIEISNRLYASGEETLLSDDEYDFLWDFAKENYPDLPQLNKMEDNIECKGRMQKLPLYMNSLDKIKDKPSLIETFKSKNKGDFIISDKIDGVSALLYCKLGEHPKLYTKGNGDIGQNVSQLIPYIKNIPVFEDNICSKDLVVRGELMISKKVFEEKYKGKFPTARHFVARFVISRSINDKFEDLKDVEFIAYQQITPKGTPEEQLQRLKEDPDFKTVYNRKINHDELNNDYLSDLLKSRRVNSPYDIDGLVVCENMQHKILKGNPKHSFAFKMLMDDQTAETYVTGVEWIITKSGLLFPRIHVKKTFLNNVNIAKLSGYNARFIVSNQIGIGSKVVIARSGDVIPIVVKVLEPAEPALPTDIQYNWDTKNINIYLNEIETNSRVQIRRIMSFFHSLGAYYLSEGTIGKLYDSGIKTVKEFVKMTVDDLLSKKIKGIAKKKSETIVSVIKNAIKMANPIMIMDATGKFGSKFGPRKLYLASIQYPEAFDITIDETTRKDGLMSIKGFADKTTDQFLRNMKDVYQFIVNNDIPFPENIVDFFKKKNEVMDKYLVGVFVVFTEIQNNEALENKLLSEGAEIQQYPNEKTTDVVTGDLNSNNEKMELAKELCLPIYTLARFKDKYNIDMLFNNS